MSKRIIFYEYTFILHKYPIEVNISDEDYNLLQNEENYLEEIINKYDIEYKGIWEQIDDCEIDDSHYENLYLGFDTYGDWEDII